MLLVCASHRFILLFFAFFKYPVLLLNQHILRLPFHTIMVQLKLLIAVGPPFRTQGIIEDEDIQ
jgi:hypothetical protein